VRLWFWFLFNSKWFFLIKSSWQCEIYELLLCFCSIFLEMICVSSEIV
jgi:hypothetical protein